MSEKRLLHGIEMPADLRRLPQDQVEQVANTLTQQIALSE